MEKLPGTEQRGIANRDFGETLLLGKRSAINLKDDLLLAKSFDGLTAWDRAAENCNKEILELLWYWGREVQVNLKDDLFLAKCFDGLTAWDRAAENGEKEISEKLWG